MCCPGASAPDENHACWYAGSSGCGVVTRTGAPLSTVNEEVLGGPVGEPDIVPYTVMLVPWKENWIVEPFVSAP